MSPESAALTIIMHHSRLSTPPSRSYSTASAVLLNELLKGGISLGTAISRIEKLHRTHPTLKPSGHLVNARAIGVYSTSPTPTTPHFDLHFTHLETAPSHPTTFVFPSSENPPAARSSSPTLSYTPQSF
ncbi:hypothetical protein JB92DRAFT_3105222 [Gautieria morchelliformis]|nr:hypothetical protein JB92DRAFT_3105222 [Gautieria morchelliformis]